MSELENLDDNEVLLAGLDGANPLAFMASLGVIHTISNYEPGKISWVINDGSWKPKVTLPGVSRSSLVALLDAALGRELNDIWAISKRLPFEAEILRNATLKCARSLELSSRDIADTLAAWGSEIFVDDKGQFHDTAFRMVRSGDSAGQGLPDYARKLAKRCAKEDIDAALFGPWTFSDELSSFRWDPSENREYAMQATNPSKEGSQSPIGANRLAIEALKLFPTMPGLRGLETVGFRKGSKGIDAELRWPMWTVPLGVDSIRSLLTCGLLFEPQIDRAELREMGVAGVFASRQIKPNQYYRNFTPSTQL